MNTNTDNAVELNTPFVYVHTFSDGSKYFGNGVNKNRPYDFSRGPKYQAHFAQYGEPTVEVTSCQSVEEADALEQSMFDTYVANGGLKLQRRPSGKDLAQQISRGANGGKATVESHGPQKANGGKYAFDNKTGVCGRSKEKMSEDGRKGGKIGGKHIFENKTGVFAPETIGKANRIKMISMLDGRITSKAQTGHWNKKDPSYIGTWILL